MKKSKGFTLIELVIAMLILTLLMNTISLATKAYVNFIESKSINGLIYHIRATQRKAMAANVEFKLYCEKPKSKIIYIKGREDIKQIYKLKGALVCIDSFEIIFTPSGTPKLAASLNIKGKYKKYEITVEVATGKVNISEEDYKK